jgi:hypothetical protein
MLSEEPVAWQHSQSTRARAAHVREGPGEFVRTSRLDELKPHPQRPCRDVCSRQHGLVRAFAECTWQPEDSDPIDPRDGLLEQFQTLADELRAEAGQARDIAARPRKVGDEPARNRITNTSEDNGDSPGRLHGRQGDSCASAHEDDINLERNQLGREGGDPLELSFGISVFDHEVATLDVTKLTQSFTESLAQLSASGQAGRQIAYASDLGGLLGLGDERRGEEAQSEDSDDCDTSDHHAATAVCWLSIAAIFRQPPILGNLICWLREALVAANAA